MEETLERADQALNEARDRVSSLRSVESKTDLVTSLTAAADDLSKDSSIALRVRVEGEPKPLRPIVSDELFWIGREAITNAFRTSGATTIDVVITYGRRELTLSVIDDGRGIDPTILSAGGRPRHWGIAGMRERADRIGGHFAIKAELDRGTTVTVKVSKGVAYNSASWLQKIGWRAPRDL